MCRRTRPETAVYRVRRLSPNAFRAKGLDGTVEHAFPHALGGTRKSRNLYCEPCNKRLGSIVDAPFVKDFAFATTAQSQDIRRPRHVPRTGGLAGLGGAISDSD